MLPASYEKPAGNTSLIATFVAASGPTFATVTVNVTLSPTFGVASDTTLVNDRIRDLWPNRGVVLVVLGLITVIVVRRRIRIELIGRSHLSHIQILTQRHLWAPAPLR